MGKYLEEKKTLKMLKASKQKKNVALSPPTAKKKFQAETLWLSVMFGAVHGAESSQLLFIVNMTFLRDNIQNNKYTNHQGLAVPLKNMFFD